MIMIYVRVIIHPTGCISLIDSSLAYFKQTRRELFKAYLSYETN